MKKPGEFKTSIGGQALIEGIMMRGPALSVIAVRMADGTIDVEELPQGAGKKWYNKTPFIRGVFNMVDSLRLGYTCLMKSAAKAGLEDEEEPSAFEQWLAKKLGKSVTSVVSSLAMVIGMVLAIGLFAVLPSFLAGLLGLVGASTMLRTVAEGVLKIAIFLGYMGLVSKMPEIHRVYQYHGAEHKTIACYEAGEELTVENVRKQVRFHPRCGTSFLVIVLLLSILLFSVISWDHLIVRIVLKLLLLPVVMGVAYEAIKLAGRYDNIFTRILSAPGLWTQRLSTKEPDDDQIEVAIASMLPVIPKESGADEW